MPETLQRGAGGSLHAFLGAYAAYADASARLLQQTPGNGTAASHTLMYDSLKPLEDLQLLLEQYAQIVAQLLASQQGGQTSNSNLESLRSQIQKLLDAQRASGQVPEKGQYSADPVKSFPRNGNKQ